MQKYNVQGNSRLFWTFDFWFLLRNFELCPLEENKKIYQSGLSLLSETVLGLIGFLRIAVWHSIFPSIYGEHWMELGFTMGITLLGVVLWGTLSGSMLLMVLKRLGADPAVSSAPSVATLVDVTGQVIYFSVAFLILSGRLL